jgi:hypothetical protein
VDAFFLSSRDDGFVATEHTRGPWSAQHQHAGPASALLARAFERLVADTGLTVLRLTVDLLSPLRIGPLAVEARVARAGRKVQRLDGTIVADGRLVCRATALAMRLTALPSPATPPGETMPSPAESQPFVFPFFERGQLGYAAAMETRLARGVWGHGPAAIWFRTRLPLLPNETPSPLQRIMMAADSGNGVAIVLDPRRFTFLNADLTVALHRLPVTEWVCVDARTAVEPTGVGLCQARLLDERGPLGIGLQSLIVEPRGAVEDARSAPP